MTSRQALVPYGADSEKVRAALARALEDEIHPYVRMQAAGAMAELGAAASPHRPAIEARLLREKDERTRGVLQGALDHIPPP